MISVDVECDNPDCPGDGGGSPSGELTDVCLRHFGGDGGHISGYLPPDWTVQPSGDGGLVKVFCPECSKGADGE